MKPPYLSRGAVLSAVLASVALLCAACGSGETAAAPPRSQVQSPTTVPTTPATGTPATAPATITVVSPVTSTTRSLRTFAPTVSDVTAAALGATWHPGCPVAPRQLRAIRMPFWGFDGRSHTGSVVVNVNVVSEVEKVFATLYAHHFGIKEMVPESAYAGNDNAAAAADDTSGFNCRDAVAAGPPHWSIHAYGDAIDVNDVQNPYVDGTTIVPPSGAAYENRTDVRPGMAIPGGVLVDAFASVGWYWGGRWTSTPDYQHFSLTGH